ncbi:sugar ABC transporter ATP-binding protein [Lichenihabitans sp. Uapishka_5]|uniref:sugar ABC transporter ATP-binding protein n=1 Tax=Lichenihabitans sp. Uapishka_5 TaxID=3037302 RepID=UPI0029E7D1F2|nr:sugar ABC transporter ATP-binding protein [Lichenihabitans sp. Uapishka_5]MDX7952109.1 sugar ABC transporter ATP-binding protein [Lichenihabitans sp. Uapishka_5]
MTPVFEARNISKSFGPVRALSGVTVTIGAGEVHAIIGENGAGKSTLMNILCGKLKPTGGELLRHGQPVVFHSPVDSQAARIGIAPQEISLVPKLSVAENIVLGAHSGRGGLVAWRATRDRATRFLHEIDDTIDPAAKVEALSKAQQQLVQIARAVATEAEILIFDEPTATLTNRETDKLYRFIRRFRAGGGSIFYISHRLDEILDLSDRISVLQDGRSIGQLDPAATSKGEMINMMAGREVKGTHAPRPFVERSEIALQVRGLTRHGEFQDIDFALHKGEILGIAGLVGAGRTELGKCLFGVTVADAGTLEVFGQQVRIDHPADAIARGFVYLPEERKAEGIFPLLSIDENMSLPSYGRFGSALNIGFGDMVREVADYVKRIRIKIGVGADPITSLSGGNQQKVILARWLMRGMKVLILDEPTRGIDVNAKLEIQTVLRGLCDEGLSIIYISSELGEVLEVSDRILVMHEGRIKGVQRADQATQESLLQQAMS